METVNYAIIGCGRIAARHAAAIRDVDRARLVALHDSDPARARAMAEKFGGEAIDDYSELLRRQEIHALCICTPSGTHVPLGLQGVGAGKHLVVEKPLALSLEDADRLLRAAEQAEIKLAVAHPNRFLPAVQAHRAIQGGLFGHLSHASAVLRWNRSRAYYSAVPWRGTMEQDGGVLFNQAYHLLDILRWTMGEPREVQAQWATRVHRIEVPDVVAGTVRFASGALAIIEASTTIYRENLAETLSIFGERGTAIIGGRKMGRILRWQFDGLSEEETRCIIESTNNMAPVNGHLAIIDDMTTAILDGPEPLIGGAEGRATLDLIVRLMQGYYRPEGMSWPVSAHALGHPPR